MDDLISRKAAMDCCFKPQVRPNEEIFNALKMAIRSEISALQSVDAIPIKPLSVWLAGYHVSPPEYALIQTGAYDEIDPASVVYTASQIATAWAYHLRKLMESGLMEG